MFTKQPDTLGMNGDSQESNGKKRKAEQPDKPDIGGWVYVGSHNFTPSAWVSCAIRLVMLYRGRS